MRSPRLLHLLVGLPLLACACADSGNRVSAAVGAQAASLQEPSLLSGTVSSAAEGAMEGVLVGAKPVAGTVTVTVVSDSKGRYAFPAGRLAVGRYQLSIRAVGYDIDDPGPVEVRAGGTTRDVTLKPTRDLAPQLTAAEWLLSIQGTPEHPSGLTVKLDMFDKDRCTMCHSFYFVARSGHDAEGWIPVLQRMRFHSPGSSPIHPYEHPFSPVMKRYWGGLPGGIEGGLDDEGGRIVPSKRMLEQAAYLASINLSSSTNGKWTYPLRTLPRPTGAETAVVITQFDLPRPDSQPHDAAVAPDGTIWYQDFGQPYIGHLDPATGQVKEWKIPWVKPYPPYPPGGLDVQIDREGNPWFAIQRGAHLMKFDRLTEEMTFWSPEQGADLHETVAMIAMTPATNTVWFSQRSSKIFGLDLATNRVAKSWQVPGGYYGLAPTPEGNVFFFQMSSGKVGEIDTQTGKAELYVTPTPDSGPRRGTLDAQGRAWFAEYYAGKIGMFDRATKQFREWALGAPYADPYDVIPTRDGEVWAGGMVTDYVFRLNPETGQVTKYLLPSLNTNIRRMDAQSTPQGTVVWFGENHHGKITRIEARGR